MRRCSACDAWAKQNEHLARLLTTAERERDEARREREGLAEWKRDTEEHARLFLGFGQSYENESVFSIMVGANQNYSYYVGQCERLQEELEALRTRAERVVETARQMRELHSAYRDASHEADANTWAPLYQQYYAAQSALFSALDAHHASEGEG